jgi:hypothetical protein
MPPLTLRRPTGRSLLIPGLSTALLALGLAGCTKSPQAERPATAATTEKAPAPAQPAAPAVPAEVQKVMGRWLRSDGGYSLELRKADLSGVVEAAYFNPKSIHVSRAIWMKGGAGLQIMVELNDVGYPGATYVLTYDAANDRLAGEYKQPAMQQTFEVDFVRQTKFP